MDRIRFLLTQYLADKATKEEIAEMLQWLRKHHHNGDLLKEVWENAPSAAPPAADLEKIWSRIEIETQPVEKTALIHLFRHYRQTVAAAILILLVACAYLLFAHQRNTASAKLAPPMTRDIAPGKNGAILTLADGRQMVLDSLGNGVVAVENGSKILLRDGHLMYSAALKTIDHSPPTFNTMTTPNGRQFTLVLPDGSRVWLNAASSIKFPTVFNGAERRVELTGEAYFEVAKDKNRPFIVNALNTETEVLGTSFNINAYKEDGIVKATLLDGSICTAARNSGRADEKTLLTPGEQAQVRPGEKMLIDHRADQDEVMAWKNGAFSFRNADLKEVMRQLARWYDLNVIYEKGVPDVRFSGEISRNVPLSNLLKGLKDMEVHFRIEEHHKLIVMP